MFAISIFVRVGQKPGLLTGHDQSRASGQEISEISRIV